MDRISITKRHAMFIFAKLSSKSHTKRLNSLAGVSGGPVHVGNLMKTDDLVTMLAAGIEAIDARGIEKRISKKLFLGLLGSLVIFHYHYGVRNDIFEAIKLPTFWFKFGFSLSIAAAAAWAILSLSRPGLRTTSAWLSAAAVVGVIWLIGTIGLVQEPPGNRLALMLGHSWHICSLILRYYLSRVLLRCYSRCRVWR